MKRNRKNNTRNSTKKERVIMFASSAFVLAALTMTGVYMRSQNTESENDGYSLDLAEMEDSADDKLNEIAQSEGHDGETALGTDGTVAQNDLKVNDGRISGDTVAQRNMDDALDYMPLEADSSLVEIPGLTDGEDDVEVAEAEAKNADDDATAPVNSATVKNSLQFAEADGLRKPVNGDVLLPFSMDGSIYFSTLDQYKYNPALMLAAEVGSDVLACAEAKVIDIFSNEEIGQAVKLELGNGYEIIYGQLENLNVSVGDYVEEGEVIATVAAPTKYFSVEGSNLYLKLTAEGVPLNPELLFR